MRLYRHHCKLQLLPKPIGVLYISMVNGLDVMMISQREF